jgi:hypothetical protein
MSAVFAIAEKNGIRVLINNKIAAVSQSLMNKQFQKAWSELLSPFLRRPKRLQVAALCYKQANDTDDKEILLVTSRDTGRWIIPKGWPIDGKNASEAALQEAWEEAGRAQRHGHGQSAWSLQL